MKVVTRVFWACMILAATLVVMGPGYAGWTQELKIRTHGRSGILAVGIGCLEVCDGYIGHCNRKECGDSSISWSNGAYLCDVDGVPAYESIDVLITSGCPHYSPQCTVKIGNGGSIPARLKGLNVEWSGDDQYPGFADLARWGLTFPDGRVARGVNINSLERELQGCVLDPDQAVLLKFGMRCSSYAAQGMLTIRPDYVRWNKPM